MNLKKNELKDYLDAIKGTLLLKDVDTRKFIKLFFSKLDGRYIEKAVRENIDLVEYVKTTLYLDDPEVREAIVPILRIIWSDIEEYLTDVPKVRDMLCRDPVSRRVLSTKEGIHWLNTNIKKLYEFLYYYTFSV